MQNDYTLAILYFLLIILIGLYSSTATFAATALSLRVKLYLLDIATFL